MEVVPFCNAFYIFAEHKNPRLVIVLRTGSGGMLIYNLLDELKSCFIESGI